MKTKTKTTTTTSTKTTAANPNNCRFCTLRPGTEPCAAIAHNGYTCTRPKGHKGPHVACGNRQYTHALHTWTAETPAPTPTAPTHYTPAVADKAMEFVQLLDSLTDILQHSADRLNDIQKEAQTTTATAPAHDFEPTIDISAFVEDTEAPETEADRPPAVRLVIDHADTASEIWNNLRSVFHLAPDTRTVILDVHVQNIKRFE